MSFVPRFVHFYQVPFTGLGLHNGFRGNHWLENRIEIFKKFVLPSLLNQGSRDFYIWFCWRPEEKENTIVKEFQEYLSKVRDFSSVHTFGGIPFWDDKYGDKEASERLLNTLKISLPELKNHIGEIPYVLVTIQPSDDMYLGSAAKDIKKKFIELLEKDPHNTKQAVGYRQGYIMNLWTKELAEYDTFEGWKMDKTSAYRADTIPPFFTILFSAEEFLDPWKHYEHLGPYKSHEFIGDHFTYSQLEGRGFIVGCHGENISTTFNHRYKGRTLKNKEEAEEIMIKAGILFSKPITFKPTIRYRIRKFINYLPFRTALKKIYYALPRKVRIV